MSDPFIGEIRIFGFTFAPYNWAFCNGQRISISNNTALYAIIGTTYGGDGRTYFNLPNLGARVAINQGVAPTLSPYVIGANGGDTTVALTPNQLPSHTHTSYGDVDATTTSTSPKDLLLASIGVAGKNLSFAQDSGTIVNMAPNAMQTAGLSPAAAHQNMQPYLPLNFCIALQGEYPVKS